jgi:hypothetical protein
MVSRLVLENGTHENTALGGSGQSSQTGVLSESRATLATALGRMETICANEVKFGHLPHGVEAADYKRRC